MIGLMAVLAYSCILNDCERVNVYLYANVVINVYRIILKLDREINCFNFLCNSRNS